MRFITAWRCGFDSSSGSRYTSPPSDTLRPTRSSGPSARLSKVARYDSGCCGSTTEAVPPDARPRPNVAVTTTKKATARAVRPRLRWPRPGRAQARTQGSRALRRGRSAGSEGSMGAERSAGSGWDAGTGSSTLFLDHPDADLPLDVGVQLHRHRVDAERLDRLLEEDAAL